VIAAARREGAFDVKRPPAESFTGPAAT
jgi:hypothetical protein